MNVGSMLGIGGGNEGGKYQAGKATLANPVSMDQIDTSYAQTQSGLAQQQAFVNALAAQNGMGLQSQGMNAQADLSQQLAAQGGVGNQTGAFNQQQMLANQMAGQNGVGNQSQVFNQQQALANQMQGVANGTGPNPAQAELAQATGQNIAAQGALMAGQRGASANVGLMGRQIANQGAATQQQAVGQGATLQAQQQLAAMGQLQGQQAAMGNMANAQVGQQQAQQQGLANLATQQIGQQGNINQSVAGMGGAAIGQQAGGLSTLNQSQQGQQQALLGGMSNYNTAQVGGQTSANSANAAIQGINAQGQQATTGGIMKGIGLAMMNEGGMVPNYADGGEIVPTSFAGKFFREMAAPTPVYSPAVAPPAAPPMEQGGEAMGKAIGKGISSMMASKGGDVKGTAKVAGDSVKNDNVKIMVSPGEVVIPRSVMNSPDPVSNTAKFVAAILAQRSRKLA